MTSDQRRHFAKTGVVPPKLHRWLLDAAEQRIAGDYEIGSEITLEDVQLAVPTPGSSSTSPSVCSPPPRPPTVSRRMISRIRS
jgi:hypothetical protein